MTSCSSGLDLLCKIRLGVGPGIVSTGLDLARANTKT